MPCYSLFLFFPLSFPVLFFLFFPMSFLLLAAVSPDLLYLKWLGCVVSAHVMGLLQKLSCLPSQWNTILSIDQTTWQWWCQKLPPYTDHLLSMDGWCLRRRYFPPMILSNIIPIHLNCLHFTSRNTLLHFETWFIHVLGLEFAFVKGMVGLYGSCWKNMVSSSPSPVTMGGFGKQENSPQLCAFRKQISHHPGLGTVSLMLPDKAELWPLLQRRQNTVFM